MTLPLDVRPQDVRVGNEVFDGEEWVEIVAAPFEDDGAWFLPIDDVVWLVSRPEDTVKVRRKGAHHA